MGEVRVVLVGLEGVSPPSQWNVEDVTTEEQVAVEQKPIIVLLDDI